MNMIVNLFQRRIDRMFPGFFGGSTKHNHYDDFGWKEQLEFNDFYHMYRRNSVASAGVSKTITKTWETNPMLWETEDSGETPAEKAIEKRFTELRVWRQLADADRRSMVGRFSALLFQYADNKDWDQPVNTVPGGLEGLVGLIPLWESQIRVMEYDKNPQSPNYGKPLFYEFMEARVGDPKSTDFKIRKIHPDRLMIWSDDGSMNGESALEAGFNDLVDIEKVKGAGAESFWKNSRGAPIIEAPEGVKQSDVAKAMGVENSAQMIDAINEQIESFQKGFDQGLMLGGLTAKPLSISLPNPEQFFTGSVQSFAASLGIPLKVLMGSQTGERSSTEDAKEWHRTIMSRRLMRVVPLLHEFTTRLRKVGVIEDIDWILEWESLIESTADEKMARAEKMANINSNMQEQPAFSWEEIRETAGYDPDSQPSRPLDPDDEDSDIVGDKL